MNKNIEIVSGYNGDDFKNDRISIRMESDNLYVLLSCKQRNPNINQALWVRFIYYRAVKIFRHLYNIYPLGGNLTYYIH